VRARQGTENGLRGIKRHQRRASAVANTHCALSPADSDSAARRPRSRRPKLLPGTNVSAFPCRVHWRLACRQCRSLTPPAKRCPQSEAGRSQSDGQRRSAKTPGSTIHGRSGSGCGARGSTPPGKQSTRKDANATEMRKHVVDAVTRRVLTLDGAHQSDPAAGVKFADLQTFTAVTRAATANIIDAQPDN